MIDSLHMRHGGDVDGSLGRRSGAALIAALIGSWRVCHDCCACSGLCEVFGISFMRNRFLDRKVLWLRRGGIQA